MKLTRRQTRFCYINRRLAREMDFHRVLRGDPTKDELEELLRQAVINTGGKPAEAKEK